MNRNPWTMNKNINQNINNLVKNMCEMKIDHEEEEVEIIIENPEKKAFVPFAYKSFEPVNTYNTNKVSNLYSRFCNNAIQEGVCKHPSCTFAHTVDQYSPMKCRFNCQNRRCQFYHSWENIEEYIQRNNIFVHENIRMQSVVEHAKNSVKRDLKKMKENPHSAQLNLVCSLSQVAFEVTRLNKLGYNNINLKIKENSCTKIIVDNLDHYMCFINENIHNFTFDKLDTFITNEKHRLSFILNSTSIFYIRNLIVNKDETLVNKTIQGELNGLDFINKIHECVSSKINKSYNLREIQIVEENGNIVIDVVVDEF